MDKIQNEILKKIGAFLGQKFTKKGQELIDEVEKKEYKDFFTAMGVGGLWAYLKLNDSPIRSKNNEGITVLIPINEKGEPIPELLFDWLKASAMFPFELDPWEPKEFLSASTLEHVLLQLAHASHYEHPKAADLLRTIARQWMRLEDGHPFMKDTIKKNGMVVLRFSTSFCPDFKFPQKRLEGIEHKVWEMDKKNYSNYFSKLYRIELKVLSNIARAVMQAQVPKFMIWVIGSNVPNSPIWFFIKKIMKIKLDSKETTISGSFLLKNQNVNLNFLISDKTSRMMPADGIIFAQSQDNPESKTNEANSKAFLFIDTPRPNPHSAKSTNLYLESYQIDTEVGYDSFIKFLRFFIKYQD